MKEELSCGQQCPVNHSLCSHSYPYLVAAVGPAESSMRSSGPLPARLRLNPGGGGTKIRLYLERKGWRELEGKEVGGVRLRLRFWSQRNL